MFKWLYQAVRQFVQSVDELNGNITRLLKVYETDQVEKASRAAARDQLALLLGEGSALIRSQDFSAVQSWEEKTTAYLNTLEASFNLRFQNPNADQPSSRSRDVTEAQIKARVSLLNEFISELR